MNMQLAKSQPAELLTAYSHLFNADGNSILDLACGQGQNGLYLHKRGLPVQFADRNAESLANIQAINSVSAQQCWQVDFETEQIQLAQNHYQAIIVFRYLHRPLLSQIKQAVKSGGVVIYETFTTDNRQFGRPNRDEFLLQLGELKTAFNEWQCLHYFEGIQRNPDRAIAQIVCRKP